MYTDGHDGVLRSRQVIRSIPAWARIARSWIPLLHCALGLGRRKVVARTAVERSGSLTREEEAGRQTARLARWETGGEGRRGSSSSGDTAVFHSIRPSQGIHPHGVMGNVISLMTALPDGYGTWRSTEPHATKSFFPGLQASLVCTGTQGGRAKRYLSSSALHPAYYSYSSRWAVSCTRTPPVHKKACICTYVHISTARQMYVSGGDDSPQRL